MMAYPHKFMRWLAGLIFPYRCLGCRIYLENSYLCKKCFNALPIRKQMECIGCRRMTPSGQTCPFCKDEYLIDRLMIVSDFNDPILSTLIKSMKYKYISEISKPLHQLTRKYLTHVASHKHISLVADTPLIVPVPLHKHREHERGFNQAELLAQQLASGFQLEMTAALNRMRYGKHQADIEDRETRILNAKNSNYEASRAINNRNILLIDDVCTTGATLNECARVLKNAGARSVTALVIARG